MSGGIMQFWDEANQRRVPVTQETPVPVGPGSALGAYVSHTFDTDQEELIVEVGGRSSVGMVLIGDADWYSSGGALQVFASFDGGANWSETVVLRYYADRLSGLQFTASLWEPDQFLADGGSAGTPQIFAVPVLPGVTHLRILCTLFGVGSIAVQVHAHAAEPWLPTMQIDEVGVVGRVRVRGDVAHDAANSSSSPPVLVGAEGRSSDITAVANGDRTKLVADLTGKQVVLPYAVPQNFLKGKTGDITNTTATSLIAAQGAGVRIYVTALALYNSHATVGTWVDILDNTTAIYTVYLPPAGGKAELHFPVPLQLTANQALQVQCATTGSNVRANASGYKGV